MQQMLTETEKLEIIEHEWVISPRGVVQVEC